MRLSSIIITHVLLVLTAFFVAGRPAQNKRITDFRDAPHSSRVLASLSLQAGGAGIPAVPAPAASASQMVDEPAAYQGMKEWTLMVFMNGKNNLEQYAVADLNEMERIGSSNKFNAVVEMGRIAGYDTSNGDWRGVRRFYITGDHNRKTISSKMVGDLGDVDMGSTAELENFVRWAKAKYPARKYMLIIWNHGAGWKGISYDDTTANNMAIPDIARSLARVGGVDVLASDACLMQMAEVVYEFRHVAKYIVGSEETEPGRGYAYNRLLFRLQLNPGRDAESMSKAVVKTYGASNFFSSGATMSFVETAKLADTAMLMNRFAEAAMKSDSKDLLIAARDATYDYEYKDNKDLARFVQYVAKHAPEGELKYTAGQLYTQVTKELVGMQRRSIITKNKSKGVAVYVPNTSYSESYGDLALSRDTRWAEMVRWLVE